ncbi:hypothetical protein I7I53_01142 [Histoplasma capsulatum var. duboisii H88]|uniref:Uncharacterized protein n=1 Tax=Ajellomyces capsulatus (strain H88) TaxID=544711 RepID=A0A8A1LHC9_AJEC8|nr:hypothetical protein I7I53_01142 [Histoplasma capsulatum var. duboisii H88]
MVASSKTDLSTVHGIVRMASHLGLLGGTSSSLKSFVRISEEEEAEMPGREGRESSWSRRVVTGLQGHVAAHAPLVWL